MEAVWYGIVTGMLAAYVALDGYDLGAGALHFFVARGEDERREVLAAIGPFWDGNEVWLVAGGGALVLAFPVAYAVGFSGFYLPLVLVLWLLVLRGLSIEFRKHVENPLWATFWDGTFALGSSLLAVVLGVALGNLIRGVPLDGSGRFSLPLFAGFPPRLGAGVLDSYTALIGLFSLVVLAAHGGAFLSLRTQGAVSARAFRAARGLYGLVVALFPIVTWATLHLRPSLATAAASRPLAWAALAVVVWAVALLAWALLRERAAFTFAASTALLVGLLATAATASWPALLHSSLDPRFDLTANDAAAQGYALRTGLTWAAIGLPLACSYFVYVARVLARTPRHTPSDTESHGH